MSNRTCQQQGCNNKHQARGLCHPHYRQTYPNKVRSETVQCVVCGQSFTRRYDGPKRAARYLPCCSERCRSIVGHGWRTELPADHPARWFGQSIAVTYMHCKFCSNLFAHDARWPRTYCPSHGPDSKPRFVSGQCVECGDWFIGDRQLFFGGNGGKPHCSNRCQERRARRIGKEKRRALKRDAYVADVVRRKVYQADGWRCHICGKKVKRMAQVPDPMAPTIDHVIPLAEGGTHEPANCRTAHFVCNARKGARGGGEQMLLLAV